MTDLRNRIVNLIKRGIVSLIDDTGTYFRAQVEYLGKTKKIEVIFPYGLYGRPPKGSCAILFNVNGQEENMAGIVYDVLRRFTGLSDGEVVLGNPKTGSYVKMAASGNIELQTDADVTANCANATLTTSGKTTIISTGDIELKGSANILLGSGGQPVARLGDAVQVNPATGTGTIIAGSTKVTSV